MDPVVTIDLKKPFNEMINLLASIDNAKPKPVQSITQAIVVVCGQEKVVLKDKANKVFDIKDVKSSKILKFELGPIWEVDTAGVLQTAEDCPITEWKMCDDATCLTPSTELWHKITDDALTIDINDGIPLENKFLVAITSGKAMGAQPLKILVCGQEKVSVVSTAT